MPCSGVHAHNRLGLCALLLVLPIAQLPTAQHLTPGTWPSIQLVLYVPMSAELSAFKIVEAAVMHVMRVCMRCRYASRPVND